MKEHMQEKVISDESPFDETRGFINDLLGLDGAALPSHKPTRSQAWQKRPLRLARWISLFCAGRSGVRATVLWLFPETPRSVSEGVGCRCCSCCSGWW